MHSLQLKQNEMNNAKCIIYQSDYARSCNKSNLNVNYREYKDEKYTLKTETISKQSIL